MPLQGIICAGPTVQHCFGPVGALEGIFGKATTNNPFYAQPPNRRSRLVRNLTVVSWNWIFLSPTGLSRVVGKPYTHVHPQVIE